MKALKKFIRGITVGEMIVSAIAFALMVICYFISVVNRNFIRAAMPWTEELALYAMVYMALLGMEAGLRDGTQVSVTAITDQFKGTKAGHVLTIISRILLLFFVVMMVRYGYALVVKQMQTGQTSPVMKIPMYLLYLSLVLSFGLTLLTQITLLIGDIFHIPMEEITRVDDLIDSIVPKKKNRGNKAV
ncbi:MAG: TRAP transporter small permease [Stomatobaculum sp.]